MLFPVDIHLKKKEISKSLVQSAPKRPNQFIMPSAIYNVYKPSISHIIFIFCTISTNFYKVIYIFIYFIFIEAYLCSTSMFNFVNSLFMSFDLMSNGF